MKFMLLLLSVIAIILSWAWLDGLLAGLISAVISILWILYEGDRRKMENRGKGR